MLKTSIRLKEFIDDLGLSVDGFRVQCGIKSSATMAGIIHDGKRPSDKTLQKIIKRYPQLSKDWIETGVGEMYLDQFTKHNNSSTGALQASRASQFSSIEQSLMNHDFAISELTKMVQKALIQNNQDINRAFKTLGELAQEVLNFKAWAEEKENERMEFFEQAKTTHFNRISDLNDERRIYIRELDQERKDWLLKNEEARKKWMEDKHDENRVWTESKLKENQDWVESAFQHVKKDQIKAGEMFLKSNQDWYNKQEEQRMVVIQKIKSEVLAIFGNTNKEVKELGQLSINSKPQK